MLDVQSSSFDQQIQQLVFGIVLERMTASNIVLLRGCLTQVLCHALELTERSTNCGGDRHDWSVLWLLGPRYFVLAHTRPAVIVTVDGPRDRVVHQAAPHSSNLVCQLNSLADHH